MAIGKGKLTMLTQRATKTGKEYIIASVLEGLVTSQYGIFSDSIIAAWKECIGNEVEFEFTMSGEYMNIRKSINPAVGSEKKGEEDREITGLSELLNAFHRSADMKQMHIESLPMKIDYEKGEAMFKVSVKYSGGMVEAHGYAIKSELNDRMKPYWLVFAETRALVRALRWITNSAHVAIEELNTEEGDENGDDE